MSESRLVPTTVSTTEHRLFNGEVRGRLWEKPGQGSGGPHLAAAICNRCRLCSSWGTRCIARAFAPIHDPFCMAVKHVHAAVQSDRGEEHERELQRVPRPFRSAHDRGTEKKVLLDLLVVASSYTQTLRYSLSLFMCVHSASTQTIHTRRARRKFL